MLSLYEVTYRYHKGDFYLNKTSLSVSSGECVALVGKNGSGKTTVGKLSAGLLSPLTGEVTVDGDKISSMTLGQIGSRIGYLFQEPSRQLFALNVLEELTFPMTIMEKQADEEKAEKILEKLQLSHLKNQSVFSLSRGEKQRLAIAAMLMGSPSYMVLDEPTTGLDMDRRKILSRLLKNLMGNGLGILLISHDMDFVSSLADTIKTVKGGVVEDET